MNFLQQRLGPFPIWVWGLVVAGGVVLFLIIRARSKANAPSSTSSAANSLNPTNDPQIDPNTGVPYQIEEAIDPNTGQPYYIEMTNPGNTQGYIGNQPPSLPPPAPPPPSSGPPGPIPPQPGPNPAPPASPTASAGTPMSVATSGTGGGPPGPIPPQPGPGGGGRFGPHPPQPGPGRGSGEPYLTDEDYSYPFWAGQGGTLYARR